MLDQSGNPFLLEVNLSPACAERTTWLTEMQDRMSDGLFNILEPRLAKLSDDIKPELKEYLK